MISPRASVCGSTFESTTLRAPPPSPLFVGALPSRGAPPLFVEALASRGAPPLFVGALALRGAPPLAAETIAASDSRAAPPMMIIIELSAAAIAR